MALGMSDSKLMGGLVAMLHREVTRRCGFHARLSESVSQFAACMLAQRSCNLALLAEALPRQISSPHHRQQYLSRALSNPRLSAAEGMAGFIPELLLAASEREQTVILMVDQTQLTPGFECLMLSVRMGERAFPLLWTVQETRGAIGWNQLEPLLNRFADLMPLGLKYCLMADRFYGHSALINWCDAIGFNYRIRLKHNINLMHESGEITTGEAAKMGLASLENAMLGTARTHIGILHEPGHAEPWIIAMPEKPTKNKALGYGMRWGVEAMFSDFKSRGFHVTESKLRHAKRLENLIFIIALAVITASFIGIQIIRNQPKYIQKNIGPPYPPSPPA